ncbi:MAG TPA: POTRA domain-containing protein, partial [Phycisphaerales bacterium]|nr:POTRA domain-containing protein [Phycisphaerales bacterium]
MCAGATIALGQPVSEENRDTRQPPSAKPAPAPATAAAMEGVEGAPVRNVRLVGLTKTPEGLVWNQIRTKAGQPLNTETVRADVARLNRLARFREVSAKTQPFGDGSVEVVFEFVETKIIHSVDIVGNRQIPNSEISPLV